MPLISKNPDPTHEDLDRRVSADASSEAETCRRNGSASPRAMPSAMTVEQLRNELEERISGERALQASAERYQALFLDNPSMYFTVAPNASVLTVNPFAAEQLGYRPQDLVGRSFLSVVHPDDRLPFLEELAACLASPGSLRCMEFRQLDRSGAAVRVKQSARTAPSANGYPTTFLVCENITERHDAVNALRESEDRLRLLTDHMPAILWVFDQDLRLTSMRGGRPLREWSMKPSQFAGRSLLDIMGLESRDAYPIPLFLRALAGESVTFDIDWRQRRFHVHVAPFRRSAGQPSECIGVSLDITDRVLAEEALSASECRYRAIVEDQMELVCRWKPDTTLSFVNRQYATILGRVPEDLIGVPLLSLLAGEDRRDVEAHLAELVAQVTPENPSPLPLYEQRVVGADQEVSFLQWTERGIFDEHGRLLEIQSVGRDVTALKQADARIREHQAQLAQVARARTLGETAAGLAHELNQPLSAVINFTRGCIRRLRSGQTPTEELIDAMGQVVEQAERAGEIVRGLRRFISQTDALRVWLSLNELVAETLPFAETETRRYGVRIRTHLAPEALQVQVDRIQLEQVILNLVRNAAEAMHETGGEVIVRTKSLRGGQAEVAVCDQGVGISTTDSLRIFEPFFTTKPNGLGIGLALSRSIVEAHGGRLWATPNPEVGTTFHFTLPGSNGRGRDDD